MDLDTAKFLLQMLEFLVVGACSVYVYIANKNRVTNERITEMETALEDKLDGHGERIAVLETRADSGPSHGDLSSIHDRITGVGNQVSDIGGRLAGIESNLRQIMGRIMEKGMS